MGSLKDWINIIRARITLSQNPLYQVVLKHVKKEIHESPHDPIHKLPEETKEKIIYEICETVQKIWQAPDKILANREFLVEMMLAATESQIMIAAPDNDLCEFDGISGELKQYISEFVQERIDSNEYDWEFDSAPSENEAYVMVWMTYWKATFYQDILNENRIHLKDYDIKLERDWHSPLYYSLCAFWESEFRRKHGLPELISGMDAIKYSTLADFVQQGHKDPLEEWEEHYDKKFPIEDIKTYANK
jgi:hypothetical protein